MSPVSRLLDAATRGDRQAAAALFPVVYEELRMIAAARLVGEKPGQTLQATALVHEAYLRLVGDQQFENRQHFFAAAAEAMRRILVEAARRRRAGKRGGGVAERDPIDLDALAGPVDDAQLLDIHEVLDDLGRVDPEAAALVKLRFFGGLTASEAAEVLGMSVRSAHDLWAYARTWLRRALRPE